MRKGRDILDSIYLQEKIFKRKETHLVFIDKEKLKRNDLSGIKIFGSIVALKNSKDFANVSNFDYNKLFRTLGKDKKYQNDKFVVKKCKLTRQKMKK